MMVTSLFHIWRGPRNKIEYVSYITGGGWIAVFYDPESTLFRIRYRVMSVHKPITISICILSMKPLHVLEFKYVEIVAVIKDTEITFWDTNIKTAHV